MPAVFKEWRLECDGCHQITKHLGWENGEFPTDCACGGHLHPEHRYRRVDGVVPDDIPGGMVMEHVCPGRRVYSRTELKQVLASKGFMIHEGGWAGPNDRYFTRGSGVTKEALEQAAKIVTRVTGT